MQITVSQNTDTIEATICEGETYEFGTHRLKQTGKYTEKFENKYGCDSTVVLFLTVNQVYQHVDEVSICQGETYQFGTRALTQSGNYTEVFKSTNGCDSTVILTLTVNPVYNQSGVATICNGQTYVFGSQTLTTAGNYIEVFQSVNGCDSIVNLTLSVYPVFNNSTKASICAGENYEFGTQSLNQAGEYYGQFETANGCDSVVHLSLTVFEIQETVVADTIAAGDSLFFGEQALSEPGEYTQIFNTVNGCDSIVKLHLAVKNITSVNGMQEPGFFLRQNYPNPFSAFTAIPFELNAFSEQVVIMVYDLEGRMVLRRNFEDMQKGSYHFEWNTKQTSGIYLCKMYIKQNNQWYYSQTKQMIVQ